MVTLLISTKVSSGTAKVTLSHSGGPWSVDKAIYKDEKTNEETAI
jgi:hypothetical protein